MPTVSITPKIESRGFLRLLGKLLHPIADVLFSRELRQVRFERNPEFERQYFVFGRDEEAIREFLSDQGLWRLSRDQNWQIETEKDLFTFTMLERDYLKMLKADVDLKQLASEALVIFDLFRER